MRLEGLVVPTPTLFGPDGELDPSRNSRFARALCEAHVDHLFPLGSLGEFPSVTDAERATLLEAVIESLTGKTDAWVGCGAPSTAQAVRYALKAEEAGAAALIAVPPFYLHPTEPAIGRYYRAIHAASKLPLLAYNIPSLVGYALRPSFVHELGQAGVLAGLKDTAGSLSSVAGFLEGAPPGFVVLPGDDVLAAEAIRRGASGAVMGLANVFPKLGVELVKAARGVETERVGELQRLVEAAMEVIHSGPFPSTGKFLAARLRRSDVGFRAPYDPLSPEEEAAVLSTLARHEAALRPYV